MKQSKIGMIGCGMISEVYAKNITERFGDLQLVACADLRMEAAQARAEQFGTKAMTVDELLADPDIDIVLNLTIPDQHAAVSMAALKAGKNVYSEKPLAIHMQDAKELVEYAKAHNLLLGTAPMSSRIMWSWSSSTVPSAQASSRLATTSITASVIRLHGCLMFQNSLKMGASITKTPSSMTSVSSTGPDLFLFFATDPFHRRTVLKPG